METTKFIVFSKLGVEIRTTDEYWNFIIQKHKSIKGLEEEAKKTIRDPDLIKISREDPQVFLYYSKVRDYHLCVVIKHLNNKGFIITAYLTDNIKKGEVVYEKDRTYQNGV